MYSHAQVNQMFDSFYGKIEPSMNPIHINKHYPEKLKEFWWERFIEALENKKPLLHNMSYTELPIMWLNAYTQQQDIIDQKDDRISHLVQVKQRANSEIEELKKIIAELKKPLD